jgi:pilus assembly protein Flp/PilA
MSTIVRFAKDETGATAIEYGLLAAFIALGIIASAQTVADRLGLVFTTIASGLK